MHYVCYISCLCIYNLDKYHMYASIIWISLDSLLGVIPIINSNLNFELSENVKFRNGLVLRVPKYGIMFSSGRDSRHFQRVSDFPKCNTKHLTLFGKIHPLIALLVKTIRVL